MLSKSELEKQMRQSERQAQKNAVQLQASSIVHGQPRIAGFQMMDRTAEEVLQCLLKCKHANEYSIGFSYNIFPEYIQRSTLLEFEKLVQYGMVSDIIPCMGGCTLTLLPTAISYFKDKEDALNRKKKTEEKMSVSNITNYGNIVFGDVSSSELTVDNRIHKIEQMIDEHGGEDKEDLKDILDEVKELLDNIKSSRSIPKQKKLFQRITDHMSRHDWFYGDVIQLLGTSVMQMIEA